MSERQQDPQQSVASGARHVEETEHLASGLEMPSPVRSLGERELQEGVSHDEVRNVPGKLLLTMLRQGERIQVRAGSPFEPSNTFEGFFDTPEDAYTALRDAGVLPQGEAPDPSKLPTGLELHDVSIGQLAAAGLQHRRSTSSL